MKDVKVIIMESEIGWGQRVDEVKTFTGETASQDAEDYVTKFNSKNDKDVVPDWYMYAYIADE